MVAMRQIWPFLVLLLHCATAQSFEISRPVTGLDTFNVPSFMCGGSRYRCSSFYAEGQASSCICSCPASNSTFTFSNNQWICMENAQARNKFQPGCEARTTFTGQNPDNRIPSLAIGSTAEISIRYWLWEYWTCTLDISSSWFIGCNGSKVLFTHQYNNAASQLFSIRRIRPVDRYVLEVNAGKPGSHLLQGKIINLAMHCRGLSVIQVIIDICLLLKIEGKETCPVDKPTNSNSSSIQSLTTMYSHGSTSSRLESTVAASETPTASSLDFHTSLRTSAISPSAAVSSQVAAYSSREVSSSRRIVTSDILSTALVSSHKPLSLRTSTSVKSKESATSTTANLPTSDATPTTLLRLTTSRSSPKASVSSSKVSSVTAEGAGLKVEILPTLNILPTARIPSEVVEVSPTINEGRETPVLAPPTEASGVEPTTFEPKIPPNVGSGRKEQTNGLYIGVSTGITVFIIITVVIVGSFMYQRRCSKVQPRARSLSEETKVSVLASPRNSTFGVEEADITLKRSSMYVPNYGIPLWEDEPDNGPIYAVIRFAEGANPEVANHDEPFYYVLEQAEVSDKELEDSIVTEDPALLTPGPQFKEDHIYAEVDFSKKRLARNSMDMSELINSRENSGNSDGGTEPVLEVLRPYVVGGTESEEPETGSQKSVYFTLENCFSDTFKRTKNDPECENVPVRKGPEGPDQYKAICTEALVYYTLKRSGSDRQNNNNNNDNNNSKFTIGQVFDQLEERYLNKTEQPGIPLSARPGLLLPRRLSGKKDKSDTEGVNEPVPVVYNFFEEVCSNGPPKYKAVTNHEGPVYFHLRRLKSNHSRATRIQPRWQDEPIYAVVGEQYLKGAEGKDKPEEKPVYFTLEELCSDTLKRPGIDCQDTEPGNDIVNECYDPSGSGEGSRSQWPGATTMKRTYPNSGKKSNDESPC